MKPTIFMLLLLVYVPRAFAQEVLPRPEYRFKGVVGTTFKDSDPAKFPQPAKPPEGAPNILLVLIDDAGFGQFAVSGGGVPSPNMEKLAEKGVIYNRFHTTALCSPTRAALLTGRNHQSSGTGIITELATGYDGYTGVIPKSTATIAEILRQNGYATAWIGKNHNTPVYETGPLGPFDHWPTGLGFNYFYGFNAGDINQFKADLIENLNPIERPDDPNYHLSADLADKTIAYLQKAEAFEPEKPWFVYLALAATHSPHQAPKEWIDKFKGKFDMGWDKYREETFKRQKEMGVIPADAKLTTRPKSLPAWESLNADQKKLYSHMMEIFAAYGAHADAQVGRVMDYVKTLPDAENTMIIYIVGDNGSSAEGGLEGCMNEIAFFNAHETTYEEVLPHIDELGTEKHFNHFPAEWAWAMNTPFQWTKQVASHLGGVRNPMIISWPKKIKESKAIRNQFTHVVDIAPTILEVVGLEEPNMVNGVPQKPMEGRSFMESLTDGKAKESHTMQYFEMFANRGIYKDGWWAASLSFEPWNPVRDNYDPFEAKWELYNIDKDFSQATDLAKSEPAKLEELKALWWAQASKYNVLPLDWRGAERFSAEMTGKPNPSAGRTHFVYPSPISGLPEATAPDLKNKSFSITADVEVDENSNGMIFTQGGNTAGWAFYLKDGQLYFSHNYIDLKRYTINSTSKVPAGKHEVKADFTYNGGEKEFGKSGTVKLLVDGKVVGEGKIDQTTPIKYSLDETQDIGMDGGTPIDDNYDTPFHFKGNLTNIRLDLSR
ncbi:arylsulfatase [Limibacter armeniacum]|uniref:arylsulfatase n=1 Tax=Limibacter armeniacum TaxID=466084 RepID=UPI002FE5659B